jgi:hypothetical protein
MREISEETLESISVFIRGLNADQRADFMDRIAEKQYHIYSYIHEFLEDEISDKTSDTTMYLLAIIIRCYEYEYGEFPQVSEERVTIYSDEKNTFIRQEMNRHSLNKIANGFKRAAGQRVLINHLDEIIEGNKTNPLGFEDYEKMSIRAAIYLTVILLNEEMEKLQ